MPYEHGVIKDKPDKHKVIEAMTYVRAVVGTCLLNAKLSGYIL